MRRARIENRVATDKERRKDDREQSSKMHTKPYDGLLPRFLGPFGSLFGKRKTDRTPGRTPARMPAAGGDVLSEQCATQIILAMIDPKKRADVSPRQPERRPQMSSKTVDPLFPGRFETSPNPRPVTQGTETT